MPASDDVSPLLKNIGPAGWPGAIGMALFGIPIYLGLSTRPRCMAAMQLSRDTVHRLTRVRVGLDDYVRS